MTRGFSHSGCEVEWSLHLSEEGLSVYGDYVLDVFPVRLLFDGCHLGFVPEVVNHHSDYSDSRFGDPFYGISQAGLG